MGADSILGELRLTGKLPKELKLFPPLEGSLRFLMSFPPQPLFVQRHTRPQNWRLAKSVVYFHVLV